MSEVPVVWWNANPDAIARGYWDQGFLEALFDGEVWQVPGQLPFAHRVVQDAPVDALDGLPGAVLVVPARHNASGVAFDKLAETIRRLPWVLLILTGDEEGAFPVQRLAHPNMRVWVMTPQPGRSYPPGTRFLGSGWPPGIRDVLRSIEPEDERPLPWAFMGQVTHERREACVEMLRAHDRSGVLVASPGFTQGLDQDDYWRTLALAKVAPCPSGPCSPDSFRVYEGLEAGCLPIADNVSPGREPWPFWETVLPGVPMMTVNGPWSQMADVIDWGLADWAHVASVQFAAWQRYKRRVAWWLHDDLLGLHAMPEREHSPDTDITVIVTTSPSPHHPSIEHLWETLASVRAQLPLAEIVVAFDGVAPQLKHRAEAYETFKRRALWELNLRMGNVAPLVFDTWTHQAAMTRVAFNEARTPFVLFVEHDTPLTGEIDWPAILEDLAAGRIDLVRLHHETAIGQPHQHMMLDPTPHPDFRAPLIRTYQWSQRPHVAALGWYRRILEHTFGHEARSMIEDVMHGVVVSAWQDYGMAGWSRFRLAMYAPPGNMQRSLHLDSRRLVHGEESTADPKPTNHYAYDGAPPPGAPT